VLAPRISTSTNDSNEVHTLFPSLIPPKLLMNLFVEFGGKEEGLQHGCVRIWFEIHFEHVHKVDAPLALKEMHRFDFATKRTKVTRSFPLRAAFIEIGTFPL
jgi:hypothetical protein